MKLLAITTALLAVGSASAQVFQPVDPRRLADVNSQVIQPGDVDLPTLPSRLYPAGGADASRQRRVPPAAQTRILDRQLHRTTTLPALRQRSTACSTIS